MMATTRTAAAPPSTDQPPDPEADPLLDPSTYLEPTLQCDVVMKGGITSGVVYPRAVCEVARTYRFRSIGGTSAGAIAAAVTAAAELGRIRGKPGFPELAALPEWLGAQVPGTRRSRLFGLFQPQRGTATLFRTVVAFAGPARGRLRRVAWTVVKAFPLAAVVGAAPGLFLTGLALLVGGWAGAAFTLVGLAIATTGAVSAAALAAVRRFGRAVPANLYGLCTGIDGEGDGSPALTPWLADLLDRLAGQVEGRPLTFGDLWQGTSPDPDTGIDLRLMTTSLTHGRPYRVPFEAGNLYFDPAEMRRLFPEPVVAWMEAHPRQKDDDEPGSDPGSLPANLRRLPAPADLPVVVAARLSLSFPLLISAVPLWAVDYTRRNRDDQVPERSWFSDGGICSNFPVHFFDAALPGRPTFALNLRPFHRDYPRCDDEGENSWVTLSNGDGQSEWWNRFDTRPGIGAIAGFFGAIKNAMQNWVDNGQLKVPGYRDRVVHVSMDPDEGGLNLDMPPDVIRRLGLRGQLAAAKLARRFSPDGDGTVLTWDNHRWVRYRSSMNVLERMLHQMRTRYDATIPDQKPYAELIARGREDPPTGYAWSSQAQRDHAAELTRALMALPFHDRDDQQSFANGAPRPEPELRVVPRV